MFSCGQSAITVKWSINNKSMSRCFLLQPSSAHSVSEDYTLDIWKTRKEPAESSSLMCCLGYSGQVASRTLFRVSRIP